MKKRRLLITTVLSIICSMLMAQTPQSFNYQAVARNSDGELIADQNISVRIGILQGSLSDTSVYTETHSPTTNQYGIFGLEIGNGVPVTGIFSSIDWASGSYYLQIEVDETGGTNFQLIDTTQLLSVPYAMYSGSTGDTSRWQKNNVNLYYNNGYVGIGTVGPTTLLDVNGVITASGGNSNEWNEVYGWGDHSTFGYLSSESDPIFGAHVAFSITGTEVSNWNTVFGWGDHSTFGYLTSESDPIFGTHVASSITGTEISNWNTTFGWGNHAASGYLTSEVDPKVGIITDDYISKWNGSVLITSSIYDDGDVGIGNNSPDEKLHVTGNIKATGYLQLGTTAGISINDPCTSAEAGRIIFNGTNFCACDGTTWKQAD